ncbi:MBL fold metallo-hydrolase [Myxococcota bacterium]|nr:MBL fold metallo-hydrolase [Myxococcota bacterium]MBU1380845.1 MBL fold metallo-hydrolase [Myxococcota bacterium]MBU1499142.1 MBL fold metallo-hydrolase [Myxococcota bacterium]
MHTLIKHGENAAYMFHDLGSGHMVQANQHIISKNGETLILDPGGHKVYTGLFSQLSSVIKPASIKYLFFSHQDPDIIAAANGWLMMTDAQAYLSELWMRFIPHFGIDQLVINRITPIPDSGMNITVGGMEVKLIPAHFLHSSGNFQVYDPEFKILYTGDLGASLGAPWIETEDFDAHVQYMDPFHRRYIPTNKAMKLWAQMARKLDIEIIAPQHGSVIKSSKAVQQFISWIENLQCGLDLMTEFSIP